MTNKKEEEVKDRSPAMNFKRSEDIKSKTKAFLKSGGLIQKIDNHVRTEKIKTDCVREPKDEKTKQNKQKAV
jgi:hypothetical protein